jgi:hypothetical protein
MATATATSKRYLVGVYDDEDVLMGAVKVIRDNGVKIHEVYSPFPLHGIDGLLGYKRSRLPIAAFFFGLTGTSLALFMQIYMLGWDWPMIIGGKDFIPLPTFIPVTFELTVLLAAFGMVITFFIVSDLKPGGQKLMLDPRTTDDKFVIAIDLDKNANMNIDALTEILKHNGASEINQKEVQY